MLVTSCDPAVDGIMKMTNNTDTVLTIVIEKKGHFISDSIHYRYFPYQENENSQYKIFGDTLLIVECNLNKNQELLLYHEFPLGQLYLLDKESGLRCLGEIADTIFLKKSLLKKDIKNMDNWEIYVDKYHNGGGKSVFNFQLTNTDIEW